MSLEEAMVRARAAHTITETTTCHQPGNGYRTEYICKCGAFVFATNWKQHIVSAADGLREDGADLVEEEHGGYGGSDLVSPADEALIKRYLEFKEADDGA